MMRKVLFLAVAMGLCACMQAQIVSSRSVSLKSTPDRPSETVSFIRGGLNVMGFAGDGADGMDKKMGYNFVYGFQRPIGSLGAYWGMEAGLGSRGFKAGDDEYDQSFMAHNVQASPFTFGWKYNVADAVALEAHLGAFLSCDYAGKLKVSDGDDEESVSLGDIDGWKRFDVGLNVGFGVWYDRFNLDFTYQRGFIEAIEDGEINTSNILIRLGVAF